MAASLSVGSSRPADVKSCTGDRGETITVSPRPFLNTTASAFLGKQGDHYLSQHDTLFRFAPQPFSGKSTRVRPVPAP